MAGESKISRIASSTQTVADVRFEPIKTSSQKSIVTREEMDELLRQVNDRLQKVQTAYNDLAQRMKVAG